MKQENIVHQENKIIPAQIEKEAKKALSYYPELKDIEIEFRYKDEIKKSFMQAQPKFSNLFKGKNSRSYYIFMSRKLNIEGDEFSMDEVPSDVIIGWLGHELGHIMDYREKSAVGLMIFGMRYVTSSRYIKEAERAADTYAVNHGMGEYILKTKNFILNNSDLSEAYKKRIARLYLSPEEIVVLVNKLEEDMEDSDKEKDLEEAEKETN
ncbi:hypothetical protein GCM10007103_26090 [Salinimicrobium marinum]|uniref:Uncharacterized protein n=1 Tax=Salinimicrobium marinum TaxID=680283 RepID=A0A918VYV0_9FLAO|nr:hypothetical protein [Salinimicrobium marinum]GHA43700.1 hypothetical protein GCM10007103_26090 [Salinimicrobium marinum]